MNPEIKSFGSMATGLARNPLGIIALFIGLIYGFASLVTGFAGGYSSAERLPLIYFLISFPILVLAVFTWLVSKHSSKLFAPSDFKNEDNYVRLQQPATAATTRRQIETDLEDFPAEPAFKDEATSERADNTLKGWIKAGDSPSEYEVGVDRKVTYSGALSAYIRSRGVPRGFGTLMQTFKADMYRGNRLKMSASARAEDVRNWAGFWMRVDSPERNAVSFDNMQDRPIAGSVDWRSYQIVLDVPDNSSYIAFGLLLDGPGCVWLTKFHFEVVPGDVPTTGRLDITVFPDMPLNLDFRD
jgi:hypothetical protein